LLTQQTNTLAHFPVWVTLLPYLRTDAKRLALRRHLSSMRWYNVFSGECLRETLTGLRGKVDGSAESLASAAAAVEKASLIDLAGFTPYYHMVFELQQENVAQKRAVIATNSSMVLTAVTTGSAFNSLLAVTCLRVSTLPIACCLRVSRCRI